MTKEEIQIEVAKSAKRDYLRKIMDWEDGDLTANEEICFFAELIKSGLAWTLQGMYGRNASHLIEVGCIDKQGNVLRLIDEDVKLND